MDRDAGFVLNLTGGVGGTAATGMVSAVQSDGHGGAHLMPPEQVGLPSLGPSLVETLATSVSVGPGTAAKSETSASVDSARARDGQLLRVQGAPHANAVSLDDCKQLRCPSPPVESIRDR